MMEELKLEKPIPMEQEQFKCPVCEKKIYVNIEDVTGESFDCIFCGAKVMKNTFLFELEIKKIFVRK